MTGLGMSLGPPWAASATLPLPDVSSGKLQRVTDVPDGHVRLKPVARYDLSLARTEQRRYQPARDGVAAPGL